MKHFLRTFFLLTLVGYSYFVNAQTGSCAVTDLALQNVQLVPGTTCTYRFDVAFTTERNRYIFLQSYVEANTLVPVSPNPYPNYWRCQNGTTSQPGAGNAPTRATNPPVGNPLLNVVINNTEPSNPTGAVTFEDYIPDPGVDTVGAVSTTTVTKFDLPNDLTRFNIRGLEVTLSPELCGRPFVVVTDFFASNANRNPNGNNANLPIQCVSCGLRTAAGFYSVVGRIVCPGAASNNQFQYNLILTNNTTTPIEGTYAVYQDVNNNGFFTPGVDQLVSSANATFNIGTGTSATTVLTGSVASDEFRLIVVTTLTGGLAAGAQAVTVLPLIDCAFLPVKMKSFTAVRKNQNVELVWETASEDNNRGFYVQRNSGDGWKDLSFVATKARDGNSTVELSYNYTDLNNTTKGVTQYRILQVDIDGKAKLSEVRQVRGVAQSGKVIVYPNPSVDGKVNVVFEDSKGTWNVSVADMNGRTIKQYKGVSNSVLVDNLLPGMYMIRIVDMQTGVQSNEKVIVNNR